MTALTSRRSSAGLQNARSGILVASLALVASVSTLHCGTEIPVGALDSGDSESQGGHDGGSNVLDSGHQSNGNRDAGTGGTTDAGTSDGGGSGTGGSDGGTGPRFVPCSSETQFIYVLAGDKSLHRFYPPTLTFQTVGSLNCISSSGPFSMAVDRHAQIWVVYSDGHLFKVNANTAACTSTSFALFQRGFTTFGMGFSSDVAGGVDETLYISGDSNQGLATIDTTALTINPIGAYSGLYGIGITGRAELTGTGNAALLGAFEGAPFVVAHIDKANAHIISEAPQANVNVSSSGSNFAFAAWGGDFYMFVGSGGASTDVYLFKPSAQMTTKVATANFEIVGAGVSTCAP